MRKIERKYTLIDEETITNAQNNDIESISAIISIYKRPIMRFISKFVSNEEDIEDISQETFDKAFRNISSYNPKYAFSTWIYTIAKNCCIDYCRKNKVNYTSLNSISSGDDMIMSDLAVESPEESMINNQIYRNIEESIHSLNEKYREIAELRFLREYAYEEIAEQLGLPLNTVKIRIKRAKEQLNKIWNEL